MDQLNFECGTNFMDSMVKQQSRCCGRIVREKCWRKDNHVRLLIIAAYIFKSEPS